MAEAKCGQRIRGAVNKKRKVKEREGYRMRVGHEGEAESQDKEKGDEMWKEEAV